MAKVITFSRFFPAYHPRKGEPTFFVEKIWKSMYKNGKCPPVLDDYINNYTASLKCELASYNYIYKKYHTIRGGNRWKAGDKFSPRVWSGKPYNSKQIQFAPDMEVKKTIPFEMDLNGIYSVCGKYLDNDKYEILALNDGLTEQDMQFWFMPNYDKPKTFTGQVICWNPDIEY